MSLKQITRSTRFLVLLTLVVIGSAGLGAGWLLERYEENHAFEVEADRIAQNLEIEPGMSIGDVWAGSGKWSVDLASRVGESGRVFATAGGHFLGGTPSAVLEEAETLREAARSAGLSNITVIEAGLVESRLPPGCCDAVLVRVVFHHFERPRAMADSLAAALRPGGLLLVIDYDASTPEFNSGHGIPRDLLFGYLTQAGLTLDHVEESWSGNAYGAVFRREIGRPLTEPNQG